MFIVTSLIGKSYIKKNCDVEVVILGVTLMEVSNNLYYGELHFGKFKIIEQFSFR